MNEGKNWGHSHGDDSPDALWRDYRSRLSGFLSAILAGYATIVAMGVLINYVDGHFFLLVADTVVVFLLGLLFLLRKRLPMVTVVLAFVALGYFLALASTIRSGLVGTGIVTVLAIHATAVVFLSAGRAIVVGLAGIAIVLTIGALASAGVIDYDPSLFEHFESFPVWALHSVIAASVILVLTFAVHSLRRGLLTGIADLQRTNRRIEELAYYDSLTGLPNHHLFRVHVSQRIADGVSSAVMVLISLRHFRLEHGLFGTQRGDELLKEYGRQLIAFESPELFLARLSRIEFAMWIEGMDNRSVVNLLESMKTTLRDRMLKAYPNDIVGWYAASARYPQDGESYDSCIGNVGMALKHAIDGHNDRLTQYSRTLAGKVETDKRLLLRLRKALDNREFYVAYQPKVNLQSGAVVGVEALARWETQELPEIGPEKFVPALTEANLVVQFSEIVLDRVLQDVPRLVSRYGEDVTVSVNVSPMQMLQPQFVDFLIKKLHDYGVDGGRLMLEITEDVFVGDIDLVRETVGQLWRNGVRVSLDDFGKGFSSLYYIRHIPFSELKIDRSFIDDITENEKTYSLFVSICQIANTYGYKVVAEGVETEQQLQRLRSTACDTVQGFYFAIPEKL